MGIADSFKSKYDSLEEAYYGFAEGLQARGIPFMDRFVTPIESAGVPSLPVFALILLALVSAALLVLTAQGYSLGSKSLSIHVTAGGQSLDGAIVQVSYQSALVGKGVTTNGQLRFDRVPSAVLMVRVSKAGFKTVVVQVPVSKSSLAADLKPTAIGTEDSLVNSTDSGSSSELDVVVLDYQNQQPLSDAQVLYVSDQSSGQVATNDQGLAVVPSAFLTNLRVSKTGYKTETLQTKNGGRLPVYLKALDGACFGVSCSSDTAGSSGSTASLSSNGVVSVLLNSSSGPVDGHVRLFASGGALLAENDTASGFVVFSVPMGQSVYVTADVSGFPLYDGSGQPQVVAANTQLIVTMDAQGVANATNGYDTVIVAQDAQANNLTFSALIIKPPMVELGNYQGDRWEVQVLPGHYYAYVKSDGYLEKSAALIAGKENVFILDKASPFNSASLNVLVQDEYAQPIFGASVFLSSNGWLASPAQRTDDSGHVSFSESALGSFDLNASFNGQTASQRVAIQQGGSSATLTLMIHRGRLNVSVNNAVDGRPLNANVTLAALNNPTQLKTGTNAVFDAPSKIESDVLVSASGFVPFSASVVLADGQTRAINAVLIPQGAVSGINITLSSIRSFNGALVNQMQLGGAYVVELNVTPAALASNQSVYFRVGSQATADLDDALITDYSDSDAVQKSVSYQPSSICADLASNLVSSPDGYKWVNLWFNQPATRVLSFAVNVKSTAHANAKLPLYYATQTQSGSVSAADPFDDSPVPCYPKTYEYDVPLVAALANPSSVPPVTPRSGPKTTMAEGLNFTPSIHVHYDPASNKIVADVSEVDFQIDPVYPRDTIPLSIDHSYCTIEAKVESTQPDCYQTTSTSLTFQTKEYSTACKSQVKGNQVQLASDKPVLVLSGICPGSIPDRIPIFINVGDQPAIVSGPASLDPGDHTAKLAFVINEKQSGDLTLLPVPGQGVIAVGAHSATAFSWSGPGSLSLLDADQTVGSWTYQTAPAYFSGIGTVGTRTDTASDYLSCAQAWCSGNALAQALRFFQNQAQLVATQTQFRRLGITVTPAPTIAPSATPIPTAIPTSAVDAKLTVNVMDSLSRPISGIDVEVSPGLGQSYGGTTDANGVSTVTVPSQQALYLFLNRDLTQVGNYTLDPIPSHGQKTISVVLTSFGSVTVSPSPTASVSPSPTPSGSTTPTPTVNPSATTVTLAVGVLVSAGNYKMNLTDVFAGSSPSAGIDVINSAGVVVDSPTKQKGDVYNGNGFSFTVTDVVYDADPSKASVQIQLSNSVQSAPFVPVYLESKPLLYSPLYFDTGASATASDAFVFSTVMQVTESADKAFDAFGFTRTGTQCNGLPGVYLVQAITTDGKNFQYSAQAMTLSQSPDGKPPGTLLCGFIYAQKKNIIAAKLATLASIQQANDQHSKAETKLAIFTLAPIYKAQCELLGKKVVDLKTEMSALKTDLTQIASQIARQKIGIIEQGKAILKGGLSAARDNTAAQIATDAKLVNCLAKCTSTCVAPPACLTCETKCHLLYDKAITADTGAAESNTQSGVTSQWITGDIQAARTQATIKDDFKPTAAPAGSATGQTKAATSLGEVQAAMKAASESITLDSNAAHLACSTAGGKCSQTTSSAGTGQAVAKGSASISLEQSDWNSRISFMLPASSSAGSPAGPASGGSDLQIIPTAESSLAAAQAFGKLVDAAHASAHAFASAVEQERAKYDADYKAFKATKAKCDAMSPPLFEIPFGLWPQQSQFQCPSEDHYKEKATALLAQVEQLKHQKVYGTADQGGNSVSQDIIDLWDKKIADAQKAATNTATLASKGCVALCKPKPACVESYPAGNQFTQVIHFGLSADCTPVSSTIGQDLAKSMVSNLVMKSLGPFGMIASFANGGPCNGAQGYFTTGNLNGAGAQVSGGLNGQNA